MTHRSTLPLVLFTLLFSAAVATAQTPGPPTNLAVIVNVNDTLTLNWTAPTTGGAPTGYLVQIGTTAGGTNTLNQQIGNVTTFTTNSLAEGVTYFVRVRALNASGVSGPSNEVSVTITCTTPTERPIAVTWRMLTATTAQITWVAPPISQFTSYQIEVGSATGLSDVAVIANPPARTFTTVTLPGAGTFFARVRITSACSGVDGPASTEVQIVAGVASPPSSSIVVNEFNGFVELKNISLSALAIGGWRIQTTTGFDQLGVLAATVRAGVAIAPGCTYLMVDPRDTSISIPADEPLGSLVSEGVAIVRPDGFIVDSAGRRNSFDIADPNTPFIEGTGLTPRRDSAGIASFARAGDVDTNNNAADFQALSTPTPQNSAGCGQTAPSAPTNLTATTTATTISLSWNAPATGGAPTGYFVQIGTTSGSSNILNQQIGNVTTFTTGPLAPGTYFVRVLAFNGAGVSGASNEVTVVLSTAPSGPGVPTNLTAVVSGSSVTLSWSAPSTGGAPTSYRLEAGTSPGSSNAGIFDLAPSPTSVVFAGVPNGTFYARLRAVNSVGVSGPSNEVTIVVCTVGCVAPPGPVTNLTAQVSGTSVLLNWQPPTTGATPTGYVIIAGSAPGLSDIGTFPTGSTAAFVIVAGVPPGTYFVRVRAAAGPVFGPPSNEVVVVVQ